MDPPLVPRIGVIPRVLRRFDFIGAYVFWEFATDSYDLGFGVYFEWTDACEGHQVSVHVGESSDEDTDEGRMSWV